MAPSRPSLSPSHHAVCPATEEPQRVLHWYGVARVEPLGCRDSLPRILAPKGRPRDSEMAHRQLAACSLMENTSPTSEFIQVVRLNAEPHKQLSPEIYISTSPASSKISSFTDAATGPWTIKLGVCTTSLAVVLFFLDSVRTRFDLRAPLSRSRDRTSSSSSFS
ncbi:uncharacterized protein FOMMEDRAFT_165745 [Fomitiporia mediterranea MF3/22]|uniref:uncharacterized protein n=1 Tax=Fomitiporia mediterranea (strain MF3/22) TaxID=694068 RepID=UPI00044085FF|nr:uncharacterized protein FOMMEDRAFT_165745 [Fomitiporia mediterranea MF3/22]EJD07150.1 hypothetical protein FOMMEDRAFT_165745 [Fomitiporia mediterranea MF3/22]